jgi:hypothetical protein
MLFGFEYKLRSFDLEDPDPQNAGSGDTNFLRKCFKAGLPYI